VTKGKRGVVVMGIDPGLANAGIMVIRFTASGGCAVKFSLDIHTKPEAKKRGIREADDMDRRLEILQMQFTRLLAKASPDVVATERCPSLRNPSAQRKTAAAYATFRAVVRAANLPWLVYEPCDIKQRVTGSRKAGKPEMIAGLKSLFPTYKGWPVKSRVEHVADAGGAALCAERDPLVAMLLRERK
jgi:Holliday junction resolvasome RuvABC endonuclease subunit